MGRVSTSCTWTTLSGLEYVPSELRWTTDDPLAVKIVFALRQEWAFAYSLIHDATKIEYGRTGSGDIRFLTGWAEDGKLIMCLSSPDGAIDLKCDIEAVRAFVSCVEACHPEKFAVDVDSALVRLLGENYE